MNTIIINQFAGLGDIIFIQTILNKFVEEGNRVILPVFQNYSNIAKHFPNITILDKRFLAINYENKNEVVVDNTKVIPLRFSDNICRLPYRDCMKSKYMYFGLDWQTWKDNCIIVRDGKAEDRLYYEVLGLKDNEEYNLISETFTTQNISPIKIALNNRLKNVHLNFIQGFTLIDWLKVIQNATNIHAVSSSNIYLFELFNLKAKEVHLYIRKPYEKSHENYDYLLTKNYVLKT